MTVVTCSICSPSMHSSIIINVSLHSCDANSSHIVECCASIVVHFAFLRSLPCAKTVFHNVIWQFLHAFFSFPSSLTYEANILGSKLQFPSGGRSYIPQLGVHHQGQMNIHNKPRNSNWSKIFKERNSDVSKIFGVGTEISSIVEIKSGQICSRRSRKVLKARLN